MKTIYHYNSTTGQYTNTGTARKSPLDDDAYLIPANSTDVVPPTITEDNEVAVFNQDTKLWEVTVSYVGQMIYNIETKEPLVVEDYGEIPEGYTLLVPEETDSWDSTSEIWVTNIDSLIHSRNREVDTIRSEKLYVDIPYYFDDSTAVATIQYRDDKDSFVINSIFSLAIKYLNDGNDTAEMIYRDKENILHLSDPQEISDMGEYVMGLKQLTYSKSWAHKDNLTAIADNDSLTDEEKATQIQNYDISTNW